MKKILLFISLSLFAITSLTNCNKSEETFCWEFKIEVKTTYLGTTETTNTTTTTCDLTEAQAETVRKNLESTTTSDGVTIKTTATKSKV